MDIWALTMMSKSKLTLPLPLTLRFILNLRLALAVIVSLWIQCYRFVWDFQLYLYSDFSLTISCDQRDSIGNWCNAGVSIVSKNRVFIGPIDFSQLINGTSFHLFELWYLYFILWYQFDGIMTRHWAMQRRTT